jgi:cytochrome P450
MTTESGSAEVAAGSPRHSDWEPIGVPADDVTELFASTRAKYRVPWSDQVGGFWSLIRHDDILTACMRPDVFSSVPQFSVPALDIGVPWLPIQADPPSHTVHRGVLRPYLTRKRVTGLEEEMRELARQVIGAFDGESTIDAVRDFADRFSALTLCRALNMPSDHWELFRRWAYGINTASSTNDMALFGSVVGEVFEYVDREVALRTNEPGDDLMSALLATEVDGRGLTVDELRGYYMLLISAGHDTTANTLAQLVLHLATHPEHRARLAADESLIPVAVEEVIRFYSPLLALGRQVVKDTEEFGCPMRRGDQVALVWGSGTRDEQHFDRADEFILDRHPNDHIAFGHGVHFCVGAELARIQLKVATEELLRARPDFRISGELDPTTWPTNGHRTLPITFE